MWLLDFGGSLSKAVAKPRKYYTLSSTNSTNTESKTIRFMNWALPKLTPNAQSKF